MSTTKQAVAGNSLDEQKTQLQAAGAEKIFVDIISGAKRKRPEFDALMAEIGQEDTLIVTKLDRLSRSVSDGSAIIKILTDRGVKVNVLNMADFDPTKPVSKLLMQMLFAFAEFERSLIYERLEEGKEAARKKQGFREGRPPIPQDRVETALDLLDRGISYKQVEKKTGISVATLARRRRERKIHE